LLKKNSSFIHESNKYMADIDLETVCVRVCVCVREKGNMSEMAHVVGVL